MVQVSLGPLLCANVQTFVGLACTRRACTSAGSFMHFPADVLTPANKSGGKKIEARWSELPSWWTGRVLISRCAAFPFSRPLKVLVQLLNGEKYFLFCFVFWYFIEFYF